VLRASFLERLPADVVAERFHISPGNVHVLRHRFRKGLVNFTFRSSEDPEARRGTPASVRSRIADLRRQRNLSAGQIAEILDDEGIDVSVRTVERILAEAGLPRLPRRTRLLIGETRDRTTVPQVASRLSNLQMEGLKVSSDLAGIFLFAPFIELLGLPTVVANARIPGSKPIPPLSYFLSFLALKLAGNERLSHTNDHSFDPGLGLFAGLNVLPKCTAMSTYGYSLDASRIDRLQRGMAEAGQRLGLYTASR
jgi:transposase